MKICTQYTKKPALEEHYPLLREYFLATNGGGMQFIQTDRLRALRIFMEVPHCTHVFMGLGQPFPLTVMPSSSSL